MYHRAEITVERIQHIVDEMSRIRDEFADRGDADDPWDNGKVNGMDMMINQMCHRIMMDVPIHDSRKHTQIKF